MGIAGLPPKANTPSIVDANAVLPLTVAPEPFQPIARRHPQFRETFDRIQNQELPERCSLDSRPELPNSLPLKQTFRITIPETLDHRTR